MHELLKPGTLQQIDLARRSPLSNESLLSLIAQGYPAELTPPQAGELRLPEIVQTQTLKDAIYEKPVFRMVAANFLVRPGRFHPPDKPPQLAAEFHSNVVGKQVFVELNPDNSRKWPKLSLDLYHEQRADLFLFSADGKVISAATEVHVGSKILNQPVDSVFILDYSGQTTVDDPPSVIQMFLPTSWQPYFIESEPADPKKEWLERVALAWGLLGDISSQYGLPKGSFVPPEWVGFTIVPRQHNSSGTFAGDRPLVLALPHPNDFRTTPNIYGITKEVPTFPGSALFTKKPFLLIQGVYGTYQFDATLDVSLLDAGEKATEGSKAGPVVLIRSAILDPHGTGIKAGLLMLPENWRQAFTPEGKFLLSSKKEPGHITQNATVFEGRKHYGEARFPTEDELRHMSKDQRKKWAQRKKHYEAAQIREEQRKKKQGKGRGKGW